MQDKKNLVDTMNNNNNNTKFCHNNCVISINRISKKKMFKYFDIETLFQVNAAK